MRIELDFGMTGAGSVGAAAEWARTLRQDGRLAGMGLRSFLLKLRNGVTRMDRNTSRNASAVFGDELAAQYQSFKEEWKEIDWSAVTDEARRS